MHRRLMCVCVYIRVQVNLFKHLPHDQIARLADSVQVTSANPAATPDAPASATATHL